MYGLREAGTVHTVQYIATSASEERIVSIFGINDYEAQHPARPSS